MTQPYQGSFYTTKEAEDYTHYSDVEVAVCSVEEGGYYVGWLNAGSWIAYSADIPRDGDYLITYRVASLNGGRQFRLDKDAENTVLGVVDVESTGGWQNWVEVEHVVTLPEGQCNIGINAIQSGFNLNWIKIAETASTPSSRLNSLNITLGAGKEIETEEALAMAIFPNPCDNELIVEAVSEGGVIRITDIGGREMVIVRGRGAKTKIDISNFKSGFYIVQYLNKNQVRSEKLY